MPEEVVDTPFGKFLVDPAECIGSTVKAGTVWDGPGFLQVIAREHARFGESGTTVLDVGAHLGDFTVWCARQGAWRVIACEAAPHMIRMLKANLDLNKDVCAERVVVLPVAAYDVPGSLTWVGEYNPRDSGGAALRPLWSGTDNEGRQTFEVGYEITAAPLDDFLWAYGQRVSLIKLDVQGCDGRAIIGLVQTIHRDHPAVVFEWEEGLAAPHGVSLLATCQWLEGEGYQVREWPSHPHNYLAVWRER